MPISKENKAINKVLRAVFNGNPHYARYADEKEESTIDILSCIDSPCDGVTSFDTLGLSDYPIGKEIDGVSLEVEFVGACRSEFDFFPNVVATCAFNIINLKYKCEPGTIFANAIEMYIKSPMKHVIFLSPSIWEKKLETLYLQPQKVIAWLQIVPLSDKEAEYSESRGAEALGDLFEKEKTDIFDLFRKSIL